MQEQEKQIDHILDIISTNLPFFIIDPLNSARIKKDFFDKKKLRIIYHPPPDELQNFKAKLQAITPPKTLIGEILNNKRKESIKKINLLSSIGTKDFTKASLNLYGQPGKQLVKQAYKLMALDYVKDEETIKSSQTLKLLKDFLKKSGLKYKIRRKEMTASAGIYPSLNTLYLKKKARFSQQFVKRLIVHEICTHIFRAENGKRQSLRIFFHGFPNYLVTEEGLTAYNEEITGLLDDKTMKNYAGRVIAVHHGLHHSFTETYKHLKDFFPPNTAFRLTMRAKRGLPDLEKPGAYTKDHIYLKGYYLVKNFVKNGGNLEQLYIGKISINDLKQIKKLDCKKPIFIPDFYKK